MEKIKKKILLIASTPLANDGLTKIEMDVIQYNAETINFEIACGFGFDNQYGEKLKKEGIVCHELPNKRKVLSYMYAINKLVRKKSYDVVYIHGNSAIMFLESFPSKMGGIRVVTHCHNTKSNFMLVHYLIKPFFNLLVDSKIGCSSYASRWAYCGKNIYTIVNGVDIEKFSFDSTKRNLIRDELGWKNNKVIGHIGRFNKQKNHNKLIDVFYEMYKKDRDCRLLLIGDGELRNQIDDLIDKKSLSKAVKIIKYTKSPQDYMQAMDVMVMPSLFEGLCLVAVEAQANGLPILIDRFFSPETAISDLVEILDLSASNTKWARKAWSMILKGRKDVSEQLKNRGMDYSIMMEKIKEVLNS